MKAYVRVIYSSDGSSPGQIDNVFASKGFRKVPGTSAYEAEVLNEGEFSAMLEELHGSLKGFQVQYKPTLGTLEGQPSAGYRQMVARLREFNLEPMELTTLLEEDPARFKETVLTKVGLYTDAIVAERQAEVNAAEAKVLADRARAQLMDMLKEGRTFHELSKALPMEEEELSQRLLELVEKGSIRAEQKGKSVVYIAL